MTTTVSITWKGREVMTSRLIGSSPTQAEPLNIGWGLGGSASGPFTASVHDVAAFKEAAESRVAGTSSLATTSSTNDTYQVVGTITSLSAQTIAEALLSDSTTKPFSTTVAGGTVVGSSSATGLTTAASYTPANNSYIQVDTEVMKVTAGSGSTSLTVVRGQNGSTAIATISSSNSDVVTTGNAPGTTAPLPVANSTVFVHASFTGLALNTNDSIAFTFQVAVSSS